jgi:hypothetical protein
MSGFNPHCYFEGSLERWSVCDGHWFCVCEPESNDIKVRVLHSAYKQILANRHKTDGAALLLVSIDELAAKYTKHSAKIFYRRKRALERFDREKSDATKFWLVAWDKAYQARTFGVRRG